MLFLVFQNAEVSDSVAESVQNSITREEALSDPFLDFLVVLLGIHGVLWQNKLGCPFLDMARLFFVYVGKYNNGSALYNSSALLSSPKAKEINLFQNSLDFLLSVKLDLAVDTNDGSTLRFFVPKPFRAKVYTHDNMSSWQNGIYRVALYIVHRPSMFRVQLRYIHCEYGVLCV